MSTIRELAQRSQATSLAKGFVDVVINIDQKLLLAVGELVEAQNELRTGHLPGAVYYSEGGKPEGFGVELADAMIRIMQLAEHVGLDIEGLILEKMAYNDTRPFKHGKQF